MPCRRTHPKSRHGCANCKKRRVKCDEQRPRCRNCINRNLECHYASSGSLVWPASDAIQQRQTSSTPDTQPSPFPTQSSDGSDTQQPVAHTTGSIDDFGRVINNGPVPPVPNLNLPDLELMLQWCTSTYSALSRDESTREIWQVIVPQEAVSQPFLMHGMLALSSLHIARLSSDTRRSTYMGIAVGHQNQALALFRPILGSINASNCNATFALSSIVTVFAFGFPQPSGPMDTLAAVDDLYQVFLLSRGMQQVLRSCQNWVLDGALGPVIKLDDYNTGLPDDAKNAIQRLREVNESLDKRDSRHETNIYKAAIDELEIVLDRIYGNPKKANIAVMWAIKIPQRYLDLLREHKPMALAILAHYSVVLHHLRKHWWLEGWSVRVLGAIWSNMDAEWRSSISWAMDVARSDVSIVPPGTSN
ncbi:hypothetical protein FQN54_003728 [Arachnomyces sp. PD_36]|nr:hypothetical protein FQN54_003728 [Arachnomyces sp. PD_36]